MVFEKTRIVNALVKAFDASNEGNKVIAQQMTESIMENILRVHREETPTIEDIQDLVVDTLIKNNYSLTTKKYIEYRYERAKARAFT